MNATEIDPRATSLFTELVATAGIVDPTSRFRRLQELGPVVRSDFGVLVSGRTEALTVLRDTRLVANPDVAFANLGIDDWRSHPLAALLGESLFFDAGETHAAVRRVVAHFFTPGAVEKLSAQINEIVSRRMAETTELLQRNGSVDLVESFARPVPIEVACLTLGLDPEHAPRLSELLLQAQLGAASLDVNPEDLSRLADVGRELGAYLDSQLDGLLSTQTIFGEIGRARQQGRLTPAQARSLAFVLLGAGFETTSNLIANAARIVLDAPSAPTNVGALIEHALRIEPPLQLTARGVSGTDPVDIGGLLVQPGTSVIVLLGAASRDEEPSPPTLAFGSGVHHCIGHHLARLQASTALEMLVPFLHSVEAMGSADWRNNFSFRSLATLAVKGRSGRNVGAADHLDTKVVKKLQRQRRRRFSSMLGGLGVSVVGHQVRRRFVSAEQRATSDSAAATRQATKAAETFGEMRGVMMKYGQMFSYAAPALDPGARAAMSALQDGVVPMPLGTAERIIEAELKQPLSQLFASFDRVPIAAASIGQVHRATLRDGTNVAVKVQFEGIAEAVAADLAELERNNKLMARFVMKGMDPGPLSQEITERISEEIDYRIEARNQIDFGRRYSNHPFFRIPKVFASHSTQRVLTSEWIDGLRWNDFVESATQSQKDRVGEMIARLVFAGVRRYGSFQADAHPGNFIVAPDGSWLGVLDFGLVKTFSAEGYRQARHLADAVYQTVDAEPITAAEAVGYFKPGHTVTAARFREFIAPVKDAFGVQSTMTHAMYERAIRTAYDPRGGFTDVTRQANAPAETILQDRLAYGSMALLAQLNATGDWIGIIRQYGGDGGPTTELGRIEDEWFKTRRS